jgi:hypothetical protein
VPASKGTVGPFSSDGLLISDAVPWPLRLGALLLGIVPAVVVNVIVPVGAPTFGVPMTVALNRTGVPKGAVVNGTVYSPF